jgi:hypothetical protein
MRTPGCMHFKCTGCFALVEQQIFMLIYQHSYKSWDLIHTLCNLTLYVFGPVKDVWRQAFLSRQVPRAASRRCRRIAMMR